VQHLSNGDILPGGWWDALGILGNFTNPQWNIGFNVSYPLGQLTQKAASRRSRFRSIRQVTQLKAQELTVSTQVINAGLNVENSYKLYLASVKSREAAEVNADAAQVRFDNGLLTNVEVVSQQNALTKRAPQRVEQPDPIHQTRSPSSSASRRSADNFPAACSPVLKPRPVRRSRFRRFKRPMRKVLIILAAALLATGGWWIYRSGGTEARKPSARPRPLAAAARRVAPIPAIAPR
jgi:hypothetical protein